MAVNREIYRKEPIVGRLTQGSIINGCIAENFPKEEVYGCIITPRCALEHDGKVPTVHYLPVVPFERWFNVIEIPIIRQLWKRELVQKINSSLSKAKVGNDIMNANFEYEDMLKICEQKIKDKNQKENLINLLNDYYDKDEEDKSFNSYVKDGKGSVHTQLKQLIENKDVQHYLIETWDKVNGPSHYVIMLRDVRRLQIEIVEKIKAGVSEDEISPIDLCCNDLYLTSQRNHFYWVEAELISPYIEHIMQAFTYNFAKIGVEDIAGNTESLLLNRVDTK